MTTTEIVLASTAVVVTIVAAGATYGMLSTRGKFIAFAKANPTARTLIETVPKSSGLAGANGGWF